MEAYISSIDQGGGKWRAEGMEDDNVISALRRTQICRRLSFRRVAPQPNNFHTVRRTIPENYLFLLPMILSGRARLLNSGVLRSQLAGLERSLTAGHEKVTHAAVASANATSPPQSPGRWLRPVMVTASIPAIKVFATATTPRSAPPGLAAIMRSSRCVSRSSVAAEWARPDLANGSALLRAIKGPERCVARLIPGQLLRCCLRRLRRSSRSPDASSAGRSTIRRASTGPCQSNAQLR